MPCWLSIVSYPTHAHEIIVKYWLKGMVLGSLLWDKVYKSDSFGLEQVIIDQFRVYLGVKTSEVFCFISIVRAGSIMLTSLFYVSAECHRFLHQGRAPIPLF